MSNLIPFDSNKLPAYLQPEADFKNPFGAGGAAAFPVLSLKGKVFTINRSGEKTLITKPGDDDQPASSLEVVVLNQAPKTGKYAKTFYAQGFVEGSAAKPDCYSNDGVSPASDAQDPQANKCALCPQAAAGSGATAQNPKAKACKSSMLLAVAPAGQLNDPMLLRVPGDSLTALREYGDMLEKRKAPNYKVVTKVTFDYTVPHQKLKFSAIGFVTPEMYAEIVQVKDSDIVKAILGEKPMAHDDGEEFAPVKPKLEAPKAEPKKPAAKPAPAADDDDLPPPKASVKVEDDEKPKAAPKAKPAAKVVEGDDLDSALDALDFDDE